MSKLQALPGRARRKSWMGALAGLSVFVFFSHSYAQQMKHGTDFADHGCYARLEGDRLTLGNAHIRRAWKIREGQLYATSLFDMDHKVEWIGAASTLPSPTPPGGAAHGTMEMWGMAGVSGPTEAASLRIELRETAPHTEVTYQFQIFPGASGIRMSVARRGVSANSPVQEKTPNEERPHREDAIEHIQTGNQHLRLTQVTLRDRTDKRNELVFEDEWLLQPNEGYLALQGNLFYLEDTITGDGLVFLKEAPQPEMRPVKNAFDATMTGSETILEKTNQTRRTFFDLSFYGQGFQGEGQGYASTLIAYQGGRPGRVAALQRYQREIRQYRPGRDGQLLSNTWGDRSGSKKLNDAFIRGEIDAGKRLGIDIVQVDDGWEVGKTVTNQTSGGVWEGFRAHQADFWQSSTTRFPAGFLQLSQYAQSQGMRLGKWFAPDSSNDFQDWKLDADQILNWYQTEDIAAFKFDSVKIRSKQGESNYHALTERVMEGSSGKILLDLDVTAETRQGYFGNIAAGPLFVENRYTDWHRYWPHQTLRNLWKLAQYVDPVRLRMEFLNSERNANLYSGDPLAPANYRSSTLFATVMFASPLGWFETSSLSPAYIADAKPLIAAWKSQRDAIYQGTTLPIGEAPDGVAWTGFQSASEGGRSGYLLIFRELNAESTWTAPRALLGAGRYRIQLLGGEGRIRQSRAGFEIDIPQKLGFVWARLDVAESDGHAVRTRR